ncbi:MAG: PEP-CTERM sorting domain-containing protein [Verrucomicrobiales bacterium]|nr:PEP-CTERM sorting domain-containing protein [Verrucomicrobiales bacterium]
MQPFLPKVLAVSVSAAALSLITTSASAQTADVTKPGDTIILVNGTNDTDGNAGAPPAGEVVEHAIDNVGQKYLNFLDIGSGFAVAPSAGSTIVTGLRLFTANDAVERDPASYLLEGSSSLDGVWTTISSGDLALPAERNAGGANDLSTAFSQEITFANTAAYGAYRLTFPTLKNAEAANSMQIAEVELLGVVVPEPSTFALLGLAGLASLALKRRKA